jgi:transcriptional regulator with XRE-family HTH domain
MSPQSASALDDAEIFALIKLLSGKRIEQRRRREGISQPQLAAAIGRSERWIREMEAGIPTSTIEDHIRCAHWLGLSTAHMFILLLCVENGIAVPRDLLDCDDLWRVEEPCIEIVVREQASAHRRQMARSGRGGGAGTP